MYHQVRIGWIIRYKMDCKIMWPIHPFVHCEGNRSNDRAFTGLENHRTDGQVRRSAPLHNFDIGIFFKA
jgi:hypothetical protein